MWTCVHITLPIALRDMWVSSPVEAADMEMDHHHSPHSPPPNILYTGAHGSRPYGEERTPQTASSSCFRLLWVAAFTHQIWPRPTLLGNSKTCGEASHKQRSKARETESMSLVTCTPMALEIDHRDLTNRINHGEVGPAGPPRWQRRRAGIAP